MHHRVGMLIAASLIALVPLAAPTARAHGGGLNSQGCHHDRANGTYHCHPSSGVRARAISEETYIRSTDPDYWREPAVHYRDCAEVRAAGAAPLRQGDPGYTRRLDRDRDGVACERPRR